MSPNQRFFLDKPQEETPKTSLDNIEVQDDFVNSYNIEVQDDLNYE